MDDIYVMCILTGVRTTDLFFSIFDFRNESDIALKMIRASPERKNFLDFPWTTGSIRPVIFMNKAKSTSYSDVLSNRPRSILVVLAFVTLAAITAPILFSGQTAEHFS